MKKLLLIRHAKAVHDVDYTDFERPLKHSGTADAILMAERLNSEAISPQLLVTSPALRTLATADIFAEHLELPKPEEDVRIYDASQQTLLDIVNQFPDNRNFIGLVAHNPGIGQLLNYFTDDSQEMSPGAAALITFDVDEWRLISNNTGKLIWFSSPKDQ
ncbi:MAG: histidine phosphatase family protein [Mucilaginibacter sp.]|nr:histidine phosphatase family protein [Mucilaginibacter sp.]